jgi:hypothetical protein
LDKTSGRLIIEIALNGQRLTQILHPIHNFSSIIALGSITIHLSPFLFTGHNLAHKLLHFPGKHLSLFTIAILMLNPAKND